MSTATDHHRLPPHIALFPSAGMGHLTPILRLASMLASRSCHVTLVTAEPAVSAAEAAHITAFLAAYPAVNRLPFQTLPFTPPAGADPFFAQFEAINRSVHLLAPTLSSASPPISAVFSDIASVAGVGRVADELRIPIYVVSTTSARFTALVASMPALIGAGSSLTATAEEEASSAVVRIPSLDPYEISVLPPLFFIPGHLFTKTLVANALAMRKAKGILTNTFSAFEPETIAAVNGGKSLPDIPPFLPIGPLQPHKLELGDQQSLPWLDQQPPHSVAYVSFGSRTALSQSQIAELRNGLEESGRSFLWVVKSKIVDRDDTESDLEELVGNSSKGMVVKGWVNQESILSHPAIGCFVSHCGWNSAVEAAAAGVPVVAWPQLGDQKVNAAVVEAAGLGRWEKGWGWAGERLVKSGEIAEKVKMVMDDEKLREKARRIGEEAKEAIKEGGSSDKVLMEIIEVLSKATM